MENSTISPAASCTPSVVKSIRGHPLCHAYINSSRDSMRGTDICMVDFWNKIFEGFEAIMIDEFAYGYIICDAASLHLHFRKKITKIIHLAWIIWGGWENWDPVEFQSSTITWLLLCTMTRRVSHFHLIIASRSLNSVQSSLAWQKSCCLQNITKLIKIGTMILWKLLTWWHQWVHIWKVQWDRKRQNRSWQKRRWRSIFARIAPQLFHRFGQLQSQTTILCMSWRKGLLSCERQWQCFVKKIR